VNAHGLNQAGDKTPPHLQIGDLVYFYRPPTQQEVTSRTRKAKHLAHYHGPARVLSNVDGRERQYNLEYQGKVSYTNRVRGGTRDCTTQDTGIQ
jgi:hypothetical protein